MEEKIDQITGIDQSVMEEAKKVMTRNKKKSKVPLSKKGNIEPIAVDEPPPLEPRPPTPEPIQVTPVFKNSAIEVARDETVRRGVEVAFNNASRDMSTKADKLANDLAKAGKTPLKPTVDGTTRSITLNRILNYKEQYEGKITWRFKDQFIYQKMSDQQLEDELESVRLIVDSQDLPANLKGVLVHVVGLFEDASLLFGFPYFGGENRASFKKNIAEQVDNGYFDSEIEQLIVEYGHLFAQSPVKRLAYKTSMVGLAVAKKNAPALFQPKGDQAKKWNAYKNKNKDL